MTRKPQTTPEAGESKPDDVIPTAKPSEPNDGGARIPPELEAELDEEEKEFRALRRDLDGVKGASAAGIVTISVGKAPPKNEFFRTHPTSVRSSRSSIIEQGMDKHFFAVTPDMVEALSGIGITVSDHTLYLTVTSRRRRPRRAGAAGHRRTASRTNTTAPRRSA